MERELDLTPAAGSAAPHCSHSNGIHQTQRITQPQFGGFKYGEMFKTLLSTVSTLGIKSYGVCQNVEKKTFEPFSININKHPEVKRTMSYITVDLFEQCAVVLFNIYPPEIKAYDVILSWI